MFLTPGSRPNRKRIGGNSTAPLALNFGTITTNPGEPTPGMALSIYGTWNNAATTFDAPRFMNITATASAALSLFDDIQVGGSTLVAWGAYNSNGARPALWLNAPLAGAPGASNYALLGWTDGLHVNDLGLGTVLIQVSNAGVANFIAGQMVMQNRASIAFNGGLGNTGDTFFYRDGVAGVAAINQTTSASGFRVYNTTDQTGNAAPTNYERGVFDWTTTANTLTIGTQAGGTGTSRAVTITANGITITSPGSVSITGGNVLCMDFNGNPRLRAPLQLSAASAILLYELPSGNTAVFGNSTTATAIRVYNTVDTTLNNTPTNWEAGVIDWRTNSNMLSIGPQAGGTGTLRDMGLYAATKNIWILNSANTKVGSASGAVWQQHHDNYGGL